MSRGHEPEEFLGAREPDTGREPNTESPARNNEPPGHHRDDRSELTGQHEDRSATRSTEARSVYELRGHSYRLRDSEIASMVELGKFRAIAQEDLAEFAYAGDKARMRPDVENLLRQGLVELKSIPHEEMGSRQLLTLTKNGHRLLEEKRSAGKGQALYHGFTKPREAHHDATVYRFY